ncbi:MAG: ATP synthase F1 subunit delta [Erysipelothrix sp.]|nr:ATP synthase F1 subunit delta [Erysipelothrix sp.]
MNINTNMYALALYEASIESDPINYLNELDNFKALINLSDEIKDFFYKTYDEFENVREILLTDFSKPFINFIEIIYNNRALRELDAIVDKFESLLMENNYLSLVAISSSDAIKPAAIDKIITMFKDKYPKPFRISNHVDKSILGGYVIKVNGDVYDTSIKTRLNQIRKLGGVAYE